MHALKFFFRKRQCEVNCLALNLKIDISKKSVRRRLLCDYCDILRVCFYDESTFPILVDKNAFVRRRSGGQFHVSSLCKLKAKTRILVQMKSEIRLQ